MKRRTLFRGFALLVAAGALAVPLVTSAPAGAATAVQHIQVGDVHTTVTVWSVAPEEQSYVLTALDQLARRQLKDFRGFVGASVYAAANPGTPQQIAEYAQWASKRDHDKAMADGKVRRVYAEVLAHAVKLAGPDSYQVVSAYRPGSPVTTIELSQGYLTVINVHRPSPERVAELIAAIESGTKNIMSLQPGFVSSNLHLGSDGRTVTNYAQWRTDADFFALFQRPESLAEFAKVEAIAVPALGIYHVASVVGCVS
jgi:hypothetical protein